MSAPRPTLLATRDDTTNWLEHILGGFESGTADLYGKEPEWFVEEYRVAIDWCAAHGLGALGIKGLLRDRHCDYWDKKRGPNCGVVPARALCAYGRKKGVRVVLIADLVQGGGVYHESGNYGPVSEWSLKTFLAQHPRTTAAEVRQYALASVEWVLKAIPELGGVRFDYGPPCPERAAFAAAVADRVKTLGHDVWLADGLTRVGMTAGWSACGRDALAIDAIAHDCRTAPAAVGFELAGGASPYRATVEFNYLALAWFAADPARTIEGFVREVMAPRLGGLAAAERFRALAANWKDVTRTPAATEEIVRFAATSTDLRVQGRWYSLADFLMKVRWEAEMRAKDTDGQVGA